MTPIDNVVLQFVREELRCYQLDIDSSLNIGEHKTVPEDVYELIDCYAKKFNVDCSKIYWRRYFPRIILPFLPNGIMPKCMKSDRHKPEPFTIRMLIESAKAGRWLYE
ncbi:MAG: DUF1493 family protein [Serratia inhibens]|uniref:DUF1493 family protein n=1 Tax=Serratia TaxID=613 RepID=UPI001F53A52F|nr:DUF1493 family protein [Serratia plymuthica]UNK30481.1 DUF1493 family protein [Serratia plymuthica]